MALKTYIMMKQRQNQQPIPSMGNRIKLSADPVQTQNVYPIQFPAGQMHTPIGPNQLLPNKNGMALRSKNSPRRINTKSSKKSASKNVRGRPKKKSSLKKRRSSSKARRQDRAISRKNSVGKEVLCNQAILEIDQLTDFNDDTKSMISEAILKSRAGGLLSRKGSEDNISDLDVNDMMPFRHGKRSAGGKIMYPVERSTARKQQHTGLNTSTDKKSLRRNYGTRSRSRSRDQNHGRMQRQLRRDVNAGKRSINFKSNTGVMASASRIGISTSNRKRMNSQESRANENRVFEMFQR